MTIASYMNTFINKQKQKKTMHKERSDLVLIGVAKVVRNVYIEYNIVYNIYYTKCPRN